MYSTKDFFYNSPMTWTLDIETFIQVHCLAKRHTVGEVWATMTKGKKDMLQSRIFGQKDWLPKGTSRAGP